MDKDIEKETLSKRQRKRIWFGLLGFILVAGGVWMVRSFFASSLNQSEILTAIVERGRIENTINATGELLPEFEEIITSPINASIQKVQMEAGSRVHAGESILTLNKAASETEWEKQGFQLESKKNNIRKMKLELEKSFFDLKSNNEIKQLRINSLVADLENARRLYKAGGGTREDVDKAELNLKVARLEKDQLENEIRNKQQTMQVEIRETEIAAAIQENDLKELERKLKLANIVATRDGVVTWVNKNIGASIREGESLARIADLGSFRITGSISDNSLNKLRTGMAAIARVNDSLVRGEVTNIYPSVQNGIISFDVQLNDKTYKSFRPNMKVDLYLVTSAIDNVLRVSNGPAFKGTPTQDIFVMNHGIAEKKTVHIGLSNFDYVEIKDQVKPGDQVIISDMSAFKNTRQVRINN